MMHLCASGLKSLIHGTVYIRLDEIYGTKIQ